MILFALMLGAAISGPPVDADDQLKPSAPAASAPALDADDQPAKAKTGIRPDKEPPDEDEDEKGRQSGTIVVTARRLDAARTGIDQGLGATVYELYNDTIENRPGGETGSTASILTQTPGVTLSSSGLNIRGSKAIQVRINDVIIPEAITDPEDRLSSRLAESTRVITGSLPAQFGFAPGGVIAVTTKNGLYQHGGQAELFAGSHGAFEPAFEWGGSADRSSLFATGSLESSTTRVADIAGSSASDVRHEIGGLAFADHVIDEENRVSFILGGSRDRQKFGATDLPPGVEDTADAYALSTLQHSTQDLTVQASLFAGLDRNSANFAQRQWERSNSVGTQIDASLRVGPSDVIRSGLLLTNLATRENGPGPLVASAHRTSLGVYLQNEWKPLKQLTVNAGVRAEWLRSLSSSPPFEPRVSVVWALPGGFTAHAGYARYASAPPLGEEQSGAALPNERDNYFDAGLQQKFGPVTLGVDGYCRSAHNLISEHKTPGTAVPTAFAFSRGLFRGTELSATYARGPVTAWANLTVSKSRGKTIIGSGTLFPAETLAAANGHWVDLATDRPLIASGGLSWRVGKVDIAGDVIAGSGAIRTFDVSNPNGNRAPAFASLGIAAVYHTELFHDPLDLRADLTNLTNVHYVTNDAANLEGDWTRLAEGRAILVGFEQGF